MEQPVRVTYLAADWRGTMHECNIFPETMEDALKRAAELLRDGCKVWINDKPARFWWQRR